jgi:hypothetical protein
VSDDEDDVLGYWHSKAAEYKAESARLRVELAAEKERCAGIIDTFAKNWKYQPMHGAFKSAAAAIRANNAKGEDE